jgi:hypothetical protein
MFARWMGFGALLPFARGHTAKGNIDKEPWAFGEEVEATCRRALERRYRLMPLFYTLFEESPPDGHADRAPDVLRRPVRISRSAARTTRSCSARPARRRRPTPGLERVHILPKPARGVAWREFDFPSFDGGRDSEDPDQPRLYARPGSIIPTAPVHQHFGDRPDQRDELTLVVTLDADGAARGELYEDAGEGWGFRAGRADRHGTQRAGDPREPRRLNGER